LRRRAERLAEETPTLVGLAHGFSFPLAYFEAHGLPLDWPAFLDDFQRHWPTDKEHTYVDFVRHGMTGDGAAVRFGDWRWRRATEEAAGMTKSLFHFQAPGSVAKATHAGLPWLRFIRQRLGARVHVWPLDGWDIPAGRSALVEAYPRLWRLDVPRAGRNDHQQDAYAIAAALRRVDGIESLGPFLRPELTAEERRRAEIEGWILGLIRGGDRAG
jgi:hypothetical protein